MTESHSLTREIARLNAMEQRIIDRFIHRTAVARDITAVPVTFGDRIADRVASFGGSWRFIGLAALVIAAWLIVNVVSTRSFDKYPFILLNLILSCLAALQAPIIMMSQNRQAAHDRLDAQHDYEINMKAEMEIVALHTKLDEIREQKWLELMQVQERQLALLRKLTDGSQ
jgi:uncharacterized membrane protein